MANERGESRTFENVRRGRGVQGLFSEPGGMEDNKRERGGEEGMGMRWAS